ncbi:MAG: hypothetical protein WA709_18900 [Stellaceae bacterium]
MTARLKCEADEVALAVMACITHLKHTTGSIVTVMPADAFTPERVPDEREAAWAPSPGSARSSIAEH